MTLTITSPRGSTRRATLPRRGLAALVRALGRDFPGERHLINIDGGLAIVVVDGGIVATI